MSVPAEAGPCRLTAWVHGRVQNVGFRWWTTDRAAALGLVGTATNLDDGTVEVIAEGRREACLELLESLRGKETPGRVTHVVERWGSAAGGLTGFRAR